MRIVLLVIDSGGIGPAPDSVQYGDAGANTIGHTAWAVGGLELPHLAAMGLTGLLSIKGTPQMALSGVAYPVHPHANGKDTLAGHWEMMGLTVTTPFMTYPNGFPDSVVEQLTVAFGRPLLGNEVASGTEIIQRLGARHLVTGWPIVYTSADSVLQIAAHESVVPVDLLYEWCEKARVIMQGPNLVGRIIARPFAGDPGHFQRTANRHDFAVSPWASTEVDMLLSHGVQTVAIGKITDIFSGQGFSSYRRTTSNLDGLQQTLNVLQSPHPHNQFVFTNLVEFDSHWGHRRNPAGYAQALKELDDFLPKIWNELDRDDQVWITADHGCDPTYRGTDHTRETLPWLAWGPSLRPMIGEARNTLADIAATLAAVFRVPVIGDGHAAQALLEE
ncbi:MAG: phosphopentomutase [Sulfobacillus sp.]